MCVYVYIYIYKHSCAILKPHKSAVNAAPDDGPITLVVLSCRPRSPLRQATIVARSYCDLFVLDKEDLKKVRRSGWVRTFFDA